MSGPVRSSAERSGLGGDLADMLLDRLAGWTSGLARATEDVNAAGTLDELQWNDV